MRLDKAGVLVDDKPITSPADLPKDAQTIVVSAAGTVAIRDVEISDDTVALSGPLATHPPAVAVVQCRGKYALKGDTATSITLAIPQPTAYGRPTAREVPVFYAEQDCLAAAAPADSTIDCLRAVLDATSALPDAVIDRVAPIRKRPGKLHALRAGKCDTFDFHPPEKKGYNAAYQDSISYTGYSLLLSWVELGPSGVGSADVLQALYPVVQTKDDYVIVGRERWYLSEVACRKAATTKRDL